MKTDMIRMRADDAEKALLQRAAAMAGISLSSWMRERLHRIAIEELQTAQVSGFAETKAQLREAV